LLYLLNKDVRTVRWNGEPLHEATSAIVKETMNGDFTLTVKYPISDSGIYQLIQEDMLIKAPTPVLGAQLFRIKKPVENNDHLEITAYHISDDVMQRSITPMSVTSQSCGMALSRMVQNTKTALGDFSFNSDIQDRRTFNTTETETLYSVLLDGKHSIVGTWEGELVRDNFALTVKKSRGENRGVVITTHKNLKDYQRTRSSQNVVTRIHAKSKFKPEDAEKETTIRVAVDSPLINSYPYINEKEYENNNAKSVEELQKWAQAKFSNEGIDKVSDAIKIEAYELDGQVVHMGDTVNLKSWKHNVDAFKKAIAYEFDALKEEYISLTFDDKAGTGGSRSSGGLSSAADAILGVTDFAQEIALEKALQNADLDFDHKAGLLRQEISDGIELAKAKAEEVKRELSDNIDQRFSSFNNGPLQEAKRRAEEALQNAGASTLLAQEAKRIGLDSVVRLEAFKSQAMSAQAALSGDLDVLKRTITNDIRPKQEQATTEIAKQVEALIQTKKELAGVKSAQATYEETTTRRLSELTNLTNGKASKSELTQTAEELKSRIATVQVGGINLLRNTASLLIGDSSKGYWMSASGGNGRAISVEVLDPPKKMIKNMIRVIENTNGGNKDLIQFVRLRIGEKYTISCYARVASDSSHANVNLLFRSWANNTDLNRKFQKSISHKNWQKYSFTFTADAIENSIQFGQSGAGIIEICAPKIESGTLATDYSEDPEDIENQISALESTFKQRADSIEAGVNRLTEGLRIKADISLLNVTAENIRQSVKSLETDTRDKLDQKLSLAEFEVRAGSIRQEILNAIKDKADKTLVIAEAGKLREEFSKMKVGSRNYAEDYDFSRGLWRYHQGDSSPVDWKIINGEYHVKGTTKIWKQMQIFSKEGSRVSEKNSTALLELEIGETYTLSFQGICYSGSSNVWISLRANRTTPGNPEIINGNFNLTSSWQTYQVTVPALTKPDNFDFWRIILGYNEIGHVAFRKVELTRSSTRIDAGPAPEDGKTDLVVAKSEFQKTADGLSTKMAAVENYVGQDGQRQEALRKYSREESAKQATAVRELVNRDFVGKSTYQEDVRSLERRFSTITTQTNNDIATKIAQYKQTVDGQFASITSQMAGKANQTDFQRVQETSKLYERVVGSNENDISNKVARMALTNQLFQVEVAKASASGRNLFLNSLFKRDLRERYSTYDLFDGKDQTQGQLVLSIDTNEKFKGANTLKIVSTFNGKQSNQKATFSIGGDARLGTIDEMRNKSVRFSFWAKSTVNNTNFQARAGYRNAVEGVSLTTDWKFYDIELTKKENSNATSELILHVFTAATVWIAFPKVEIGPVATPFSEAPEDTDEAIRSVQSQLAGSWAVQNLTSAGSIISQINATTNQILIEAEKIRLKGKTLLDELTAIQGYFKRLFVGEGTFATLNTDVIRTNSITADKLVFNEALANRMVSNEIITSKLVASRAFVNALKAVTIDASQIVTGTLNGDRIYGGTIRGTEINGTTITGNSRITIGDNGFLRPTQEGGLQINVPETYSASKGIGVQLFGRNFGQIPKGMFIYNSPNWNGGNLIGESVADTLLTVKGLTSLCNLYRGRPMSGLPINSNFRYGDPVGNLYRISFIAWDPRHGQMYVNDGTDTDGTWWFKPDASSSDKRLKTNIKDTNFEAIDFVKKLEFKQFDWKPDKFGYKKPYTNVGLIAQDVEKLDSSLVYLQGENLALDDFRLGNIALKAIQELSQRIETLERKLA